MALDLSTIRQQLADELTAAGIRTVVDPRSILAPCALVELPSSISLHQLSGDSAECVMVVTLIAPANDPGWLERNVVAAMVAIGATEARTAIYPMGEDSSLPAYNLQINLTVKE
jgi:hypothetical protein